MRDRVELTASQKRELALRHYDSSRIQAHEARGRVIKLAQQAIHVLSGNDPDVSPFSRPEYDRAGGVDQAPAGIPGIKRRNHSGQIPYNEVGSIGSYIVKTNPDTRPSEIFNAGFYAGVLAARQGLIDPENFTQQANSPELAKALTTKQ